MSLCWRSFLYSGENSKLTPPSAGGLREDAEAEDAEAEAEEAEAPETPEEDISLFAS